jgi:[ribosomal protein S18]-alanine N-acetyltransferase
MNKDYNIRIAVDSDLKIIANLDKAVNPTYWNINQYKECLASDSQRIYVLELNGVISGALAIGIVGIDAEILQLWVKHSCQGKGWAGKLFNGIVSKLKQQYPVNKISLEVRVDNHPAIKLYRGLGFEVINTRRDYYIIEGVAYDALIMSCQVAT